MKRNRDMETIDSGAEELKDGYHEAASNFIHGFHGWAVKEWAIDEKSLNEEYGHEGGKINKEYIDGWNAALESLPSAFYCCFE